MSVAPEKPFSPLREKLWPIYNEEMIKFIPMVLMMFAVLFNYTLVRNIKDTLVISAPGSNKDVLAFLKFVFVLPSSILFVILYAKLNNVLNSRQVYYACLLPFIAFFAIYGFVIYPHHEVLHMSPEWIAHMQHTHKSLVSFWPAVGNWSFSLFYVFSELWGNIGVAILFWQFANQITRPSEAKRFYPLFGFWSNLALVCAGTLTLYAEDLRKASGADDFSFQMRLYSYFVVGFCTLLGVVYYWMQKNILTNPKYYDDAVSSKKGGKKKAKLSVMESFRYIFHSKYLGYLAVLVLAYGVSINILEVTWKGQVKEWCDVTYGAMGKDVVKEAYNRFMGWIFIYLGLATMLFIAFSKSMVRHLGWRFSAALTPIVMLVSGIIFFIFVIFENELTWISTSIGVTPLLVTVVVGSIQNVISKGIKYAVFDPTREMAYIPLDDELKIKGKAAVDVVGGRLGKSGGGAIQTGLSMILGKGGSMAPYLFGLLILLCIWWLSAVKGLSFLYGQKMKEYDKEHQ
jgi:ATP:ADP antiporter, AAA family